MEFIHEPVMLRECLDALCIRPDGIYVDGTMGGAGHSVEIARILGPTGKLIGIDQDEDAVKAASDRLAPYRDRVDIVRDNFRNIRQVMNERNIAHADGILLDLGVSSYQIDNPERGFSYMQDAPLDMRMDRRGSTTAADLVNQLPEGELSRILRDFGEERFAGSIAAKIVREREKAPIRTTGELVRIIRSSIPRKFQDAGGHPAKRTFQALRIALNDELSAVEDTVDEMIDLLGSGGRLCIITFHSLEDRIVKNAFRTNEHPCTCPPDFPVCVCGKKPKGKVITKKPILPGKEEMERNPRAKSAKLRVFERIV
ncbi:MAG: 16S rRNA (cytosine(1402)-N(4))-methyltransferase RsmH [Lachnospiraceae bacterium]|nr:16S rRNA (cytosine(1402)-N(4))-methyltransferase RsmH [Lachnospiraceae bacterium]